MDKTTHRRNSNARTWNDVSNQALRNMITRVTTYENAVHWINAVVKKTAQGNEATAVIEIKAILADAITDKPADDNLDNEFTSISGDDASAM